MQKIGLGGSCHWCTEAIFRSLKGVSTVEQGWIASDGENTTLSEAVIVNFSPNEITLETLIAIHLHTHSCISEPFRPFRQLGQDLAIPECAAYQRR